MHREKNEEKKRNRKTKEEFGEREKKRKRNITIVLFNPDRRTSKHVLSSFKKAPVFFLSLRYVEKKEKEEEKKPNIERKKKKKKRTVLNIIIERFSEREMNEQTAYSSSRFFSLPS